MPRDLDKVIVRCLQKDLGRRFQHMQDVKIELQEIKEESESRPATTAVPARRRRARWLSAGLAGALALTAGGWLLLRSRGAVVPQPTVVPLTFTPGVEWGPTFSPDGEQVAFSWQGEKQDNWDIYIKMIGSTETRRLTSDPAMDGDASWSPDGRQIAFVRSRPGETSGTIRLISPLGGSDRRLSDHPAGGGQLSWSPDGRWLAAAASTQGTDAGLRGVRVIAVPGGGLRATRPGSCGSSVAPRWSCSTAPRDHQGRGCVRAGPCDLFGIARGGGLRRLPDRPAGGLVEGRGQRYLIGLAPGELLFAAPSPVVRSVAVPQLLAMKLSAWRDDVDIADAVSCLPRSTVIGHRCGGWSKGTSCRAAS